MSGFTEAQERSIKYNKLMPHHILGMLEYKKLDYHSFDIVCSFRDDEWINWGACNEAEFELKTDILTNLQFNDVINENYKNTKLTFEIYRRMTYCKILDGKMQSTYY